MYFYVYESKWRVQKLVFKQEFFPPLIYYVPTYYQIQEINHD